jgi:hypothetical protein
MVAKMGATKPRPKSRKRLVIICGGIAVILVVVFALLYFTNRPNYRDLEKEFAQLNIPASWEVTSTTKTGDTLGGTICLEIDLTCPQLIVSYKHLNIDREAADEIAKDIFNVLDYDKNCELSSDYAGREYCTYSHIQSRIKISVNFTFTSATENSELNRETSISVNKYP